MIGGLEDADVRCGMWKYLAEIGSNYLISFSQTNFK
jgi:hypothetical protein